MSPSSFLTIPSPNSLQLFNHFRKSYKGSKRAAQQCEATCVHFPRIGKEKPDFKPAFQSHWLAEAFMWGKMLTEGFWDSWNPGILNESKWINWKWTIVGQQKMGETCFRCCNLFGWYMWDFPLCKVTWHLLLQHLFQIPNVQNGFRSHCTNGRLNRFEDSNNCPLSHMIWLQH